MKKVRKTIGFTLCGLMGLRQTSSVPGLNVSAEERRQWYTVGLGRGPDREREKKEKREGERECDVADNRREKARARERGREGGGRERETERGRGWPGKTTTTVEKCCRCSSICGSAATISNNWLSRSEPDLFFSFFVLWELGWKGEGHWGESLFIFKQRSFESRNYLPAYREDDVGKKQNKNKKQVSSPIWPAKNQKPKYRSSGPMRWQGV